MLRRLVLVCMVLALIGGLPTFSQRSREEKLKEIDAQIEKATRQRNVGIGLTIGGGVAELIGFAILMGSIESSTDTSFLPYVPLLAGSLAIGVGGWMWQSGAKAIREWELKKIDVALRVIGPDLTKGNTVGGLGVVLRYE